jgi:hypothetical protein
MVNRAAFISGHFFPPDAHPLIHGVAARVEFSRTKFAEVIDDQFAIAVSLSSLLMT